jgi:hypothetical protein
MNSGGAMPQLPRRFLAWQRTEADAEMATLFCKSATPNNTTYGNVCGIHGEPLSLQPQHLLLKASRQLLMGCMGSASPPLWSIGQSSCLKTQMSRVRFPAQPDFLCSSRSGTESTQPRGDKGGAT